MDIFDAYALNQLRGEIYEKENFPGRNGNSLPGQATTSPTNHEWKEETTMSYACILPCTDGCVIASDSRRTVLSDNQISVYDDEQKLFQIAGTNLVVLAVGQNRFGPNQDIAIGDVIRSCQSKTRLELADELFRKLTDLQGCLGICIAVVETVKRSPIAKTIATTLFREETRGYAAAPFIIKSEMLRNGAIYGYGASWATDVTGKFADKELNVEDGKLRARKLMELLCALSDEMVPTARTIGGDTKIIVM